MVRDTTPSWCIMRECGLEPLQFDWFRAAVRLYNALTQSNGSTARKVSQADMQLSSRCDDCWSSHILSAMNGLSQIYLFKERLLKCAPYDLAVLFWSSGRGTWIIGHLILVCIHESATANAPLIINGAPSLPRRPWSHIRHTPFPDTSSLTFPITLFTAWHASDFVPTPTRIETVTWIHCTSPTSSPLLQVVICALLITYKMASMSPFIAHPRVVSLHMTYASLFHPADFEMCFSEPEQQ